MPNTTRRSFLRFAGTASLTGAVSAAGLASERVSRSTLPCSMVGPTSRQQTQEGDDGEDPIGPNFQFGLAAYSFRKHFEFMKGKPQKPAGNKSIDMFGFIDYCARHHVGAELTSYFFPPDADAGYFRNIKRHAFNRGVTICGTAIGNNFSSGNPEKIKQEVAVAKSWIDRASVMGAPHIRFFAGTARELEAGPDNMTMAIDALQECVDYASKQGVFVGVENHGKLTPEQVLTIVDGIESDWFGVNLDTGNFQSDRPYEDLRKCAPHAVNVQVKVKMKRPDGTEYAADFILLKNILAEAEYQGFVVLEFEDAEAFETVPNALESLKASFA